MVLSMKLLIVAGETSGDHYGACLSSELKSLDPAMQLWFVGGEARERSGDQQIASSSDLSVFGWVDSARRLLRAVMVFGRILHAVRTHDIEAAVLIDCPGFNLRLARALRKRNGRVFYYVSPQIWAWHQRCIGTIRECVEHVFVLFSFEAALYARQSISATCVGHPLLDRPFPRQSKHELRPEMFPHAVDADPDSPVFGLFPGSREAEVSRLYPRMLRSFEIIRQVYPGAKAVVATTPSVNEETYQRIEARHQWTSVPTNFQRLAHRFRDCIKACDAVIVTSGTATLEVACLGVPMVIVYAMHPVDYWIARLLVRIPDIGLANIVAGRRVVPELIQGQASAENIAATALAMVRERTRMERIKRDLLSVRVRLGTAGVSPRVARRLMEMLRTGRPGQETVSALGDQWPAHSTVRATTMEAEACGN